MVVDYLSSQPNRAGYQVSTKQGSGPSEPDPSTRLATELVPNLATGTPKRTSLREPRGETRTANRHVLRHAYRLENPQRLPTPVHHPLPGTLFYPGSA